MKTFVFNMGFDPSHVFSVVTSEGLEDGSQVVLITPEELEQRQKNAISEIGNYVKSLDVDCEVLTTEDFEGGFRTDSSIGEKLVSIQHLLSRFENVVLSLSGGPRDFLIPLTLAASLTGGLNKTYFRSDITGELEEVELPNLPVSITPAGVELLKILKDRKMTAEKIAEEAGKSKSTIYEKMKEMEEKGLVTSEGRPAEYSANLSDEAFS